MFSASNDAEITFLMNSIWCNLISGKHRDSDNQFDGYNCLTEVSDSWLKHLLMLNVPFEESSLTQPCIEES